MSSTTSVTETSEFAGWPDLNDPDHQQTTGPWTTRAALLGDNQRTMTTGTCECPIGVEDDAFLRQCLGVALKTETASEISARDYVVKTLRHHLTECVGKELKDEYTRTDLSKTICINVDIPNQIFKGEPITTAVMAPVFLPEEGIWRSTMHIYIGSERGDFPTPTPYTGAAPLLSLNPFLTGPEQENDEELLDSATSAMDTRRRSMGRTITPRMSSLEPRASTMPRLSAVNEARISVEDPNWDLLETMEEQTFDNLAKEGTPTLMRKNSFNNYMKILFTSLRQYKQKVDDLDREINHYQSRMKDKHRKNQLARLANLRLLRDDVKLEISCLDDQMQTQTKSFEKELGTLPLDKPDLSRYRYARGARTIGEMIKVLSESMKDAVAESDKEDKAKETGLADGEHLI